MSKGQVVQSIGDGLYRVKLKYAVEKIQAQLVSINERIAELAVDIPVAKTLLIQAQSEANDVKASINSEIPNYSEGADGSLEELKRLQVLLIQKQQEVSKQEYELSLLISESLSLRKRRGQISRIPEEKELEAWCADYSPDLSGDVGLIDINGEGGGPVIVRPGYEDGAVYQPAQDGQMMPRQAQSAGQVFFNAAILPGVQKWRPRYRLGVITNIDGDICNVRLDDAESSAQGLDITRTKDLADVPILYMDCDGAVFEAGDRVVVRFTQSGPLVIGFESNPAPCTLLRFCFEPSESFEISSSQSGRIYWGQPLNDQFGNPINPPLGTEYGPMPVWTADPDNDPLLIQKERSTTYGNRNWIGPDKTVLSWDGPPSRVFDNNRKFFNPDIGYPHPQWQSRWSASEFIYHDFRVIFRLSDYPEAAGYSYVHGASIHKDESGNRWLCVIASGSDFSVGQSYASFRISVGQDNTPNGLLIPLDTFTPGSDIGHVTHWYFSRDGRKAVCTFRRFSQSNNRSLWAIGRYDILLGFSYEVIWDRDQITVGTSTENFSRVTDFDTEQNFFSVDQDYSGLIQRNEYMEPLYCEYKGNKEIMFYLRMPQRTDSNSYSYDSLQTDSVDWVESTHTRSETPQKPQAIVSGDGAVLFEFPALNQESYFQSAREDNTTDTVTVTRSQTSTQADAGLGQGLLALDGRFDFVAVGYYVTSSRVEYSGTMQYQPASIDINRYADFPAINTARLAQELTIWLGGEEIERIVLDEDIVDLPTSRFFSGNMMPEPDYTPAGGGSTAFNYSLPLTPRAPLIFANVNLLTAAGYISGGNSVAGVALKYTGLGENKTHVSNQLAGYPSVKVNLFQRTNDDPLVLHRVGIY